ncbi:uncharacterized protein [Henckelia pumila]|uniref:uncharacterized protein n=1 Tax=Henckelia pumila TaxID=405737 RepID=UPI003C6E0862
MVSGGTTDGDLGRAREAYGHILENFEVNSQSNYPTDPNIIFGRDDLKDVTVPHNDPLLVTLTVVNYDVARIFVETRSSFNIVFKEIFDQMKLDGCELEPITTALYGFTGHALQPLGDQKSARLFYVNEVKSDAKRIRKEVVMVSIGRVPRSLGRDVLLMAEKGDEVVELSSEDQVIKLAADLNPQVKQALVDCLKRNQDVFVWSTSKLTGFSSEIMVHWLNTLLGVWQIKQKKRHFGLEKERVIKKEVDEILRAGHIREVKFPTWLSNVVLVQKSSRKWRMCVDFRDLNNAFPKDFYLLPQIDQLVDSTAGHQYLCFMDAHQGYHQIPLAEEDQDKIIPFGLKNAGTTNQRLMDKMFSKHIGKNVEVYVYDSLVKSQDDLGLVSDLTETFSTRRSYGVKLKPEKCVFGVKGGKFLGVLQKAKKFEWVDECGKAFDDLKNYLAEIRVLAKAILSEPLYIYLLAKRGSQFSAHRTGWSSSAPSLIFLPFSQRCQAQPHREDFDPL